METCVLIPREFSLVISSPSEGEAFKVKERDAEVHVWANSTVNQGTLLYPFQGTIRLDKLPVYNYLDEIDVRHRYGCYDEITEANKRKVRHCNWIRFLRVASRYSDSINVIATKIKGEPIFEAIKMIPANSELVVYFLPERPEEMFFLPAVQYLRHTLYRKTMDTILEDSPLDLSLSLLSSCRVSVSSSSACSSSCSPPSDVDDRKSLSGESDIVVVDSKMTAVSSSPIRRNRRSNSVTTTKTVRGERTLLPCEVCSKAFDRPSLLKRHMRTHTGEKPHVCMVCGKGFSTSSSLNTHRRIHSGEKPHQCQVCGKRFTASSNLYYHRMTHIKEKPHKCNLCSKSFPTPGDLKSHMYVHNGSWPFKCNICNRGFSKQTNLKNHLFLHTGDKPHTCAVCHKKFALACNLRAHMKTHESDSQEECIRCGQMYHTSSTAPFDGSRCCRTCLKMSIAQNNPLGSHMANNILFPTHFGDSPSQSEESCLSENEEIEITAD